MDESQIAGVFQCLAPGVPLHPGDSRYVDLSSVRPEVAGPLAAELTGATGPACRLLAGYRGTGKTTELYRLRTLLEAGPAPRRVSYCAISDYLDTTDIEAPDLLIALVQHLLAEVADAPAGGEAGALTTAVAELDRFIPRLELTEVLFPPGRPRVCGSLKGNENARHLYRQFLRPHLGEFAAAAGRVVAEVQQHFRRAGQGDLVLLVDHLDRLHRAETADGRSRTHERLFVEGAPFLRGLPCSVLFTMPPALIHAPDVDWEHLYGAAPRYLSPVPPGACLSGEQDALGAVLEARLAAAGVDPVQLFAAPELAARLCRASGGVLHTLLQLAQRCVTFAERFPIPAETVQFVLGEVRDNYLTGLRKGAYRDAMRRVAATGTLPEGEGTQDLLDLLAVVEYRTGGPVRYGLSPTLADTPALATR